MIQLSRQLGNGLLVYDLVDEFSLTAFPVIAGVRRGQFLEGQEGSAVKAATMAADRIVKENEMTLGNN